MHYRFRTSVMAALVASTACISFGAHAAEADDIQELKAQLKMLTERLAALENEKNKTAASQAATLAPAAGISTAHAAAALVPEAGASTAPLTAKATPTAAKVAGEGEPVVGGSMPGSFRLPGTSTSVKFGGYAKLDAIADVGDAYGAQFANFGAIPLEGSAQNTQDGQFNMHARQSRLNMETRTPTEIGELKTFLEVDFFGSARGNANTTNGEGLQLRQAYGQVGNVLAGQTWSNFMDMDAYPESLDYIGPAGLTFVRQAQVRYSDSIDKNTSYSVAIESPQTDFAVAANKVNLSDLPDLTGKVTYKDSFGQLSLRGLARKLNAGDSATGAEDSDFGWGLGLSGKILTGEKDNLMFQAVYGDGVGHYLFDVATSLNGNTFIANEIEPQEAYGGYVAYQHHWTKSWRSNVLAGYTGIDNDISKTGTAVNETVASGHLNLIWNPVPSYRVGLEYMHGYRELESGTEGELDRVQASFMYLF